MNTAGKLGDYTVDDPARLRQLNLSALRARWAIKQQQATQLAAAIRTLADVNLVDDVALATAEKILHANIGP